MKELSLLPASDGGGWMRMGGKYSVPEPLSMPCWRQHGLEGAGAQGQSWEAAGRAGTAGMSRQRGISAETER